MEPSFDHTTVVEYPVPTIQVSVKEVPLVTETEEDVTDGVTVMGGEGYIKVMGGSIVGSHDWMVMVRGVDLALEPTYPHT